MGLPIDDALYNSGPDSFNQRHFTDKDFEDIFNLDLTGAEKAQLIYQMTGPMSRVLPSALEDETNRAYTQLKARTAAQERLTAERAGTGGGIELLTDSDILSRPAPEWWIEGFFQKSTIGILAGQGGIGKSFLMLHFAKCIAAGKDAFGRQTKKGKVLYVVAEGAGGFTNRIAAWDSYHHASTEDGIYYVESGVNLSSPESVAQLKKVMVDEEIDFLILDTFSQLASIDSENDAAQIAGVLKVAKDLRDCRPGSTVVLVHHVNKAGGQVRGSSVFRDNVDTLITAKGDESGFHLSTLVSDYGKMKDGAGEKVGKFRLEPHLNSQVVILDHAASGEDGLWMKVRDALTATPGLSTAELEKVAGQSHSAFNPKLKSWETKGLVREVKVPGTRGKHYEVVPLPQ